MGRWLLAVSALVSLAAAQADDFSILYHERLAWSLGPDTTAKSSATLSEKASNNSLLSFTAFGREFRVTLEPNDVLLRRLPAEVQSELRGVEVYRGELVDAQRSWARLTRDGDNITGVIFDGAELYAIDSSVALAGALKATQPVVLDTPLIYRWRDTTGTLTDEVNEMFDHAAVEPAASSVAMAAAVSPGRWLDLGIVADTEFNANQIAQGANPRAALLSRVNVLDGILPFELGLRINVGELVVFTQEEDPFTAMEPSALLDELEEHRASTPSQRARDLTHLFTGRDLAEPASQTNRVIGIANFATVCDARFGAGLTQGTLGTAADAMIMAHEIGHNFGAPHDAEPGPCESAPGNYIMAGSLQLSGLGYSACSIQQMQPELTSACLEIVPPSDVELSVVNWSTEAVVGEIFEFMVIASNWSATDAYGLEVTASGQNVFIEGFGGSSYQGLGFDCFPPSGLRCRMPLLAVNGQAPIGVRARLLAASPGAVNVTVRSFHDTNPSNDTLSVTMGVLQTVDLVTTIAPVPAVVRLGEEFDVSATVRNASAVAAANARARVNISGTTLSFVSLSSDAGACTPVSFESYDCPFGNLEPGAALSITGRVRANSTLSTNDPSRYRSGSIIVSAGADQRLLDSSRSGKGNTLIIAEAVADLRVTVSPTLQFPTGALAEIVVTVANSGPDAATNIWLEHNGGYARQGLTDVSVSANFGTCTIHDLSRVRFDCRLPSLPAGQSLVVTIRGTASEVGDFVLLSTTQVASYDPVDTNNRLNGSYTVTLPSTGAGGSGGGGTTMTPVGGGGGGGGGGALDWSGLALLGLLLATLRRADAARQGRSSTRARSSS